MAGRSMPSTRLGLLFRLCGNDATLIPSFPHTPKRGWLIQPYFPGLFVGPEPSDATSEYAKSVFPCLVLFLLAQAGPPAARQPTCQKVLTS